jgi:outer membrane protein insertion porin family
MKHIIRLIGVWLLLGCATVAWSQVAGPKISGIEVKYVGPPSVSEQFIRSNIRVKVGDAYLPTLSQDDIKLLYGTGQFYNIRVTADPTPDGAVLLTYIVQVKPRITEVKIEGNVKLKASKIRKKITIKEGEPLDEQKVFTISQDIEKLYQKYGYPGTKVKGVPAIDELAGRGSVTFQITEGLKVKIAQIEFVGATAFNQKELAKQIKTTRRKMFSWLTGSGVFKDDVFEADREQLVTFYREHGYLDFEIKDVRFEHPSPNQMVIRIYISEGRQYKVGSVKFTGNKVFNDTDILHGLQANHDYQHSKDKVGAHGLAMDVGDAFSPSGLNKDTKGLQDFYGSKGYIGDNNVQPTIDLRVIRIPNVDTGTMDLEFQIDEGQKSSVEKIDIRGNTKTKDKVIRRELAISPGETFDMVRVDVSKQRLEGLQYFEKVELKPEPTDPPIAGRKNLAVDVAEQNTGNLTLGAGFSSVDSLVGFAEITQGNFDLFHPPTFTGAGQKFRLRVQLGTQRQDYELSFIEPWFLNRKLALGVDLYRHQLNFESPNNIFDENQTGARVSLTRALWSDFLIGSVSYTIENVGINLNGGFHDTQLIPGAPGGPPFGGGGGPTINPANVPQAILDQVGNHLFHRFGGSLAYDTRNSTRLPNHGQRTELDPEFNVGDHTTYYKVELKTGWYFPGFFKGHVLELVGRAGIADTVGSGNVPFYDRYYLGGLYSLRGFKYRNIAPREAGFGEPIGGDSYLFGSAEYSVPIFEKDGGVSLRVAAFYDAGSVAAKPFAFSGDYDDNWGLGLRLNIPHLGPLRLDYGVPIHHDRNNSSSGQFQFGVGYTRDF